MMTSCQAGGPGLHFGGGSLTAFQGAGLVPERRPPARGGRNGKPSFQAKLQLFTSSRSHYFGLCPGLVNQLSVGWPFPTAGTATANSRSLM